MHGFKEKVSKFTAKLFYDRTINADEKRKLDPPSEPTIPAFYGLPKIHKPEPIPVRPIVSSIDSPTYNLAKYAASVLGPLVGSTPHHIENTKDFVEKIKGFKLHEDEVVTSYDVAALFTSIPPDVAIQVVRNCLESDQTLQERTKLSVDNLVELIELCLKTTYFSFGGKFYTQVHGCAMGSPVSPIVTNLCMEAFEQQALHTYTGTPPRLWLRYVDDTFVVLHQKEIHHFFEHINSVNPHIRFTQESGHDNAIAFLDCHVHVNSDGSLATKVYRKPTHTDHYLQFDSHHPLIHKLGVFRTLSQRAEQVISDPDTLTNEKNHIKKSLRKCGYPDWVFSENQKDRDERGCGTGNIKRGHEAWVTIPYIRGLSENIKNILKEHGVTVFYKPQNTLRQQLVKVKDKQPVDKRSNLVYGITCGGEGCTEIYVGETLQSIRARLKQHQRPNSNPAQNSAVYCHLKDTGHVLHSKGVKILDNERDWRRRGIKEALWERVEDPTLNRKGGLRFSLSHTWDRALSSVPRRLSRDSELSRDKLH